MLCPFSRARAGCVLIAVCVSGLNPAIAAGEQPSVVVTANRFASPSLDEPIAIEIIDADAIRDSAASTLAEVLQRLGGVHSRISLTGLPDTQIDLRGFGMNGDQNTLVLLNGQRLSENELASARISALPLASIERIEILRGAGAVLFGGGATGGTINLITRGAVAGGYTGTVDASIGGYGRRDTGARVATRLGDLSLNAELQHRQADNYRRHNATQQDVAQAEVRWDAGSGFLALGVTGDNQSVDLPGARSQAQLTSDPRGSATPDDHFTGRDRSALLRGEYDGGSVRLALDLRWRNKQTDFHNDFGFGYVSDQAVEVDSLSFSPRLRWTTMLAGRQNQLTAGLDFVDWEYANATRTSFGDRDELGAQSQSALYLRNEFALSNTLRLTLGGRTERIEQSQQERLTPLPESGAVKHLSATEVAVQQRLDTATSLYARAGQSYRVANIDENRCYFAPCAPLLQPQRSQDREVGMQWQNAETRVRGSFFAIDLVDEIHYNALVFSNINLSPTRRRGIEIDARHRWGTYELSARIARTEAEFRRGSYGGVDVAGNEVPLVPRLRAGLGAGWQVSAATRINLQLDHVGQQRYDNDQANRFRHMPAYALGALKLTHAIGAWRLAAGIENLFDHSYYSYAIINGVATTFNAYPEARRTSYMSANYSFR